MTIYGEYLFAENFATGIILLFFTGKILGQNPTPLRSVFCGCCCGAYAFVLFVPIGGLLSLLGKIAFSFLMVRVAFGRQNRKRWTQGASVFLGMTVFYGGITIAILTSFSWTGVTAAAGIYLAPMTYLSVTVAASAAALFLWFLLDLLKVRRMEARRCVKTEITIGSHSWHLKGLIDSGNDLKEPLTGRPVCIIDKKLGMTILTELQQPEQRYTIVPYQAVGIQKGVLEGYRTDYIALEDGRKLRGAILAFCEENHFAQSQGQQILLPASVLEGGIYGDF